MLRSNTTVPIVTMHRSANLGAADIRAMLGAPDHVLVRSLFPTIQGEGPFAGCHALFVRLAGCNFGAKTDFCQGCDTNFDTDKATSRSFDWVKQMVLAHNVPSRGLLFNPLTVITGGEPFLHENLPDLLHTLLHVSDVQVESNGTFPFKVIPEERRSYRWTALHLVVSPKASAKGYGNIPALIRTAPEALIDRGQVHIKFVMDANPDSPHHTLPDWVNQLNPAIPVWLSPFTVYRRSYEGEVSSAWDPTLVDQVQTRANYEYAAEVAMKKGHRVSIQMHTLLGLA